MSVVVTGATGFLGLRLVRELLEHTPSLTVLARPGPRSAVERITTFLRWSGLPEEELRRVPQRLEVIDADLRLPLLGLSRSAFDRLADRVDVLWHCAADITYAPGRGEVDATNVGGTRRVLDLLSAGGRRPALCYASSIGVAGAQRDGIVPARRLDGSHGFHTPYERSKFEAEGLVLDWAERHGHPVTVFRLSVLVTDRAGYPGWPEHPLRYAAHAVRTMLREVPQVMAADGSMTLHEVAEDARCNLLPVEHAARAMVGAAHLGGTPGPPRIHHVVHPLGVAATDVASALCEHVGVRVRTTAAPADAISEAERTAHAIIGAYLPWLKVSRGYEESGLAALGLSYTDRPGIDRDYLMASLR
ncbi:SDR family oxidoreductase [Saccharothrix xinjiangensis]|uniref:SDR family oxidoreductase n=1 Tax=Saccharothrix xinjiangensis TaxID=204798 RepID=A0ABV9Y117_9PSEU